MNSVRNSMVHYSEKRARAKIQSAGLLFRNLTFSGGMGVVAISMLKSLRRLGIRTTLVCGRKVDRKHIAKISGSNVRIDHEMVFPVWQSQIQTYIEFLLPLIAKPVCDILINPFTSDILPYVDVTYIHYPKPLMLKEKEKKRLWNLYYKPYESLQRVLSARAASSQDFPLVLANSFFTADAVKRQFNINPVVIYPPVNLEMTKKTPTTKKRTVLTISHFSSHKKLDIIPRVAKDIDARFVIIGSLYDQNVYREIRGLMRKYDVEDKVTLFANASLETKMNVLQQAKVYFHTMPYEHFGISIVEGMGAGCIPVVHDSGGPREFVPSEWRYGDEEEAVSRIRTALSSWTPSFAEKMRSAAWKFREERFVEEFTERINLHFEDRLNSHS